jgi:quercetin dioxygenase-like cupin family protein
MSESSPLVIRQEEGRLFEALGAPVWRLVHPKTVGSSQLGMSICLMAPGDEIRRHSHDYEEAYFVLRGAGSMYVEGEPPIDLEPGVAVYVPPGRVHGQVADRGQPLDIILALTPPPVEGEPPRFAEPSA